MTTPTHRRVRPAPDQTVETRPFWQAANEGKLLFGRCAKCGEPHYYPRRICPYCWSAEVRWEQAKGTGVIYSYSAVAHREHPYVAAYVQLDEGVALFTNIVGAQAAQLRIGAAVRLAFEPAADGQNIPVFTLS